MGQGLSDLRILGSDLDSFTAPSDDRDSWESSTSSDRYGLETAADQYGRETAPDRYGGETAAEALDSVSEPEQGRPLIGQNDKGNVEGELPTVKPSLLPGPQDPGEPVEEQSKDEGKMAIEDKIGALKPQLTAAKSDSGLENRLEKIEVQIQGLTSELQEHKRRHELVENTLLGEIRELKQEISQLKEEKKSLYKALDNVREELDNVRKELTQERREKADVIQKNEELEKRLRENEQKTDHLRREKAEKEQELEKCRQEMRRMKEDGDKQRQTVGASPSAQRQVAAVPPAVRSVEEASSTTGGLAQSVQGHTSHDQPPVRPPNPRGAPMEDRDDEGSQTAQQPHDDPNNPNPYGRNLT